MQVSFHLVVVLSHGVQSTAVLEPLDLASVEGVGQLDLEGLAVLGLDDHRKGLANRKLGALQVDLCGLVSRPYGVLFQGLQRLTLASVGILS